MSFTHQWPNVRALLRTLGTSQLELDEETLRRNRRISFVLIAAYFGGFAVLGVIYDDYKLIVAVIVGLAIGTSVSFVAGPTLVRLIAAVFLSFLMLGIASYALDLQSAVGIFDIALATGVVSTIVVPDYLRGRTKQATT